MATQSSPLASSRSNKVRVLWRAFETQLVTPRATMERRCADVASEANRKWRQTPQRARPSEKEHESQVAKLQEEIREKYFAEAREAWQKRLADAKLRDEDWNDMDAQETKRVIYALGGEEDDGAQQAVETVKNVVVQPPQQSFAAPPPPQLSAPSISASSSTTSSYAFVNPSDFCSDDEQPEEHGYSSYTMATSHDLTSEDEDAPIPVPIRGIGNWGKLQEPPKTAWKQSSQGSSPELSPSMSSGFDFNPNAHASSSSSQQSRLAPPKRPPDLGGSISASSSTSSLLNQHSPNAFSSTSIPKNVSTTQSKTRLPGPMYVGPHLSDPSDSDSLPSSDAEAEFERFKMEMRVTKILEFHQEAAQADIALAVEIYKARKLRNGDKAEDAQRVAEHQKRMVRLQEEKEEERKRAVKTERERMREELRRRGNGRARNGVAPSVSTSSAWLDSYNDQNVDLAAGVDFAKILADAGIQQQQQQQQQQFAEPEPLSYGNNDHFASHQQHLLQQQHLLLQQQLLQQQQQSSSSSMSHQQHLLQQQQQQSSTSSMFHPPKPTPQTSMQQAVPSFAHAPSSQSEQQQYGWRSQTGAFGWFDPGNDGEGEDQDQDEFEENGEPEIPEALRQAFLKQQAQAAVELKDSFSMPMPGALDVSPSLPAPTVPAAAPSGWGVKNAAKAAVNGLGNNKPLSTPAPAPMASGWATKKAAAVPVASGWGKKAQQVPQQVEEPFDSPSHSPPKVDEPITPKGRIPQPPAKGKKGSPAAAAVLPPAQTASSSSKPSPPLPKPPVAPPKIEKPAPASPPPAPVPAGKKMNKKQRQQQQKKGGGAPPPKAPSPPPATEPEPELSAEVDTVEEEEHQTPIIPEAVQPAWLSAQSALRGFPGKSRVQLEVEAATASIFGDDMASTPRPGLSFGGFKRQQEKGEAVPKASSLLRRQMQMADAKPMGTPLRSTMELPKANGASQLGFGIHDLSSEREYWVPNASSAALPMSTNGAGSQQIWNPPSNSRSPPIEKTTSMHVNRLPIPTSQRLRRSSDPVSPSPRGFGIELPDITNKMPPTNTPKMNKSKKRGNSISTKRVTIEEVSDEEGDGVPKDYEKLPVDSRTILEPKPSVPSGMFSNIFEYGAEDDEDEMSSSSFAPTPSTAATSPPDDINPIDEGWAAAATKRLQQEKLNANAASKAKHVRWNSHAAVGGSNPFGEDNSPDAFGGGAAMGGMSIPSAFARRTANAGQNQQQNGVNGSGMTIWEMGQQKAKAKAAADDKKGMGREWMKSAYGAAGAGGGNAAAAGIGGDPSGRYANVVLDNIKRGKPAAGGNLF